MVKIGCCAGGKKKIMQARAHDTAAWGLDAADSTIGLLASSR